MIVEAKVNRTVEALPATRCVTVVRVAQLVPSIECCIVMSKVGLVPVTVPSEVEMHQPLLFGGTATAVL